MKTYMTNRYGSSYLWLLSIPIVMLTSCNGNDREPHRQSAKIDSLQYLLHEQRNLTDSLRDLVEREKEVIPPAIFFKQRFGNEEDAAEHVKQALMEQPEMIPLEPVLGGTMEFRKIILLSDIWIMAYYDDGHIEGRSIYDFRLLSGDTVEFELITSDHPG